MATDHRLSLTEHEPTTADRDLPLVVLVHGSLDRAGSFARVVRRLDDLHTVAYDRRGYHGSRHVVPVHETLDGHVDDLLAVIDGRPAVVVGHSYGGDIALGAALRPGGPGPVLAVAAYEPPMPWLGSWATRPRAPHPADAGDDPGLAAERFFRRMVGDSAWDRLPEGTREARRADGAALAAELAAIRTTEPPFDVAELAVPAVFGRGSESLPHHRASADWLIERAPDAELIEIEGAGHGAHLTHPDAFAQIVRAAVARVATRGSERPESAAG
jgi:pimeloyl-ACP methyl ester carboxylesterase